MKKKAVGRPKLDKQPQRIRSVSLSDTYIRELKKIGEGSISAGIRKATNAYYACEKILHDIEVG